MINNAHTSSLSVHSRTDEEEVAWPVLATSSGFWSIGGTGPLNQILKGLVHFRARRQIQFRYTPCASEH